MNRIFIFIFTTVIFSGCEREDQATTDPTLPSNQQSLPEIKLISFTSVYSLNNYNQNPSPVFMWDDVLVETSESCFDYPYLSDFLQKYSGDWVRGATIEKSDDNMIINVFDENHSISLKLNYDKTRMILTKPDGETEEFFVKIESGKLNVYGDENKTIRVYDDENSLMIILKSNTSALLVTSHYRAIYPVKEEDGKIILYDRRSTLSYNSTEKYYAVYNLSITNNGLETFNFTIYDMHLPMGDQIFNSTPVELSEINPPFNLIAESASLSPGQNLTGCIIFQVNSSYDKSFQLMYKSTPIISESFESSVEALTISEYFNYSTVFDIPQMNISNATIVKTEFLNLYGWGMASRITLNRQIVVLDENQNMVIAVYNPGHFIS